MMGRRALLLAGLLALLAAPAWAQGLAISRARLPNGVTVLVRENPTAPVVGISLMVGMGTRWETAGNAGISNLVQLMIVRGTTTRDGSQIVEAADAMGGSLEATGDVDFSEVAATALSRHWVEMLELVADVALRPTMPVGVVTAVRDFLLRQVRNRGDKPYDVALDMLTARVFGRHPYAWDPIGLKESLERIDRDALLAHYRRHYVPGGLVLAVSGRVKAPEVLAQATRLFGPMPAGAAPVGTPPRPPAPAPWREVRVVPGAQAQILMGALAPALTDPDYPAVKVLATVLGGGMAGRFFSELRDKQGLAYTTAARYPARVDTSYFLAQLGTAPENVTRAEAALRAQLERVQRERVSDEELRVAKAYVLGNLAMDRRTNARQAWYLAGYEESGVGYEFLDRYVTAVRAVGAADVQRVAQRYLGVLRTVIVQPTPP
ncbi:MAG TPA: pitrilysin family protein [Methylomirabilota bacterium]|nr:pitrilysin family protein [Methylomirabilota bacterium]